MHSLRGPALSAASRKRAVSSDALAMPKIRQIRQSLPAARIGQFTHAHSTECPDIRTIKNA
jgi:hypothetical protein